MSQNLDLSATLPALPQIGGLRATLLRKVCGALRSGSLAITTPEGVRLTHKAATPGPEAEVVLHRWRTLRRLFFGGDVGFAESYMDGDWDSPNLTALIELGAHNSHNIDNLVQGTALMRGMHRLLHLRRSNTRSGSKRNIQAHYDLGNDFYAKWLDAGMSYSSALYPTPELTLEQAQRAKQDRVLELLGMAPGQSVLEIGIGWGGLAERLVQAGGRVTGVTLSPAQLEVARARLAGTSAELHLRDYRDEHQQHDRIVSIEMLEAVGEEYWPAYFAQLKACLAPGGRAVLQVISIADDRFEQYRCNADFIQRYVFPGGMLPSPWVMHEQVEKAGLSVVQVQNFGQDYARTLAEWHHRFEAAWPAIAALGFPPRFRRLWTYYLCYCEAGFRAAALDVGLWQLEHAG
jgi:cyclopropane-fatty-acyl-phospholipid synthase